jgi:hypothetical protein
VAGAIGSAGDFYRVRVMRVDEGEAPDLDWRDDILYRRPPADAPQEVDVWRVEAVDVDDDENVVVLASFSSGEDAHEWLETVEEDLAAMTRSQFESAYFPEEEESEAAEGRASREGR